MTSTTAPHLLSIKELAVRIRDWQRAYDLGQPMVSDEIFDANVRNMLTRAPGHPVLRDLGAASSAATIEHARPMLSLGKTYDVTGLKKFAAGTTGGLLLQPKYDGVAISLVYEDGKLVRGGTRGDGIHGDLVTRALRPIPNIPITLRVRTSATVRGEVLIAKDVFAKNYAKEGFANARNFATGTILRRSEFEERCQDLVFIAYDLLDCEEDETGDLRDRLDLLRSLGFETGHWRAYPIKRYAECFSDAQTCQDKPMEFFGHPLDFETDGVVLKLCDAQERDARGTTSHHPKWAIALKFQGETGKTTLIDVEWNVSRHGTITPVAIFEPVELSGVTITRATLHNADTFRSFMPCVGASVVVTRRGGVIPHVEFIKNPPSARDFLRQPDACPSCRSSITDKFAKAISCSAAHFCAGAIVERVVHWCHATGMDGWGRALVQQVKDAGVLGTKIAGLYELTESILVDAAGFGAKQAANLIAEIDKTRTLTPEKLLVALGEEGFGPARARALVADIARRKLSWKSLHASDGSLGGPGREFWHALVDGGLRRNGAPMFELLHLVNHVTIEEVTHSGPFSGMTVVFTGALVSMSRDAAQKLVTDNGGFAANSVTKATTYLVVGDGAKEAQQTKRSKAQALKAKGAQIEIISESAFLAMLPQEQAPDPGARLG